MKISGGFFVDKPRPKTCRRRSWHAASTQDKASKDALKLGKRTKTEGKLKNLRDQAFHTLMYVHPTHMHIALHREKSRQMDRER